MSFYFFFESTCLKKYPLYVYICMYIYNSGHLRANFRTTTVSVVNYSNVAQTAPVNIIVALTLVLLQLSGVSLTAVVGHCEYSH